MKLMLVAEGVRELGDLSSGREATGGVWIRRLLAAAPAHQLTVVPFVLPRLRKVEQGPRGEDENAARAVREARRQRCDGLVLLRDADGDAADRRRKNEAGFQTEGAAGPPAVLGVQIETMETWLLADPAAFERALGVRRPALPKRPESLWGKPHDPTSNHPNPIYNRLVRDVNGRDRRDTAIDLAEGADLDVLARECPEGFGRFRHDFTTAFRTFDCVVAADLADGIGANSELPWPRFKTDLTHFRDLTSEAATGKRNALIMGRKTWDALPTRHRPLPDRLNLVISRGAIDLPSDARLARSLDGALMQACLDSSVEKIFVIGGAEIFRQAFAHVRCNEVILTRIDFTFPHVDARIPNVADRFDLISTGPTIDEDGFDYRIERWRRRGR